MQFTIHDKGSPQGIDQMQIKNPIMELPFQKKKQEKKTGEPVFSNFMIYVLLVDGK